MEHNTFGNVGSLLKISAEIWIYILKVNHMETTVLIKSALLNIKKDAEDYVLGTALTHRA